jgi:hypothetical protein
VIEIERGIEIVIGAGEWREKGAIGSVKRWGSVILQGFLVHRD